MTSDPVVLWLGNASFPTKVLPWPLATRSANETKNLLITGRPLREVLPTNEKIGRTAVRVHRPRMQETSSKPANMFQTISHSHWKRKTAPEASDQEKRSSATGVTPTHRKRRPKGAMQEKGDVAKMLRRLLILVRAHRITRHTTKAIDKTRQTPNPKEIHVSAMARRHGGHKKRKYTHRHVITRYATKTSAGDPCADWPEKTTLIIRNPKAPGKPGESLSGFANQPTKPPRTHRNLGSHKEPTFTLRRHKVSWKRRNSPNGVANPTIKSPRTQPNEGSPKKPTITIRGHKGLGKPGHHYPGTVTKTASKATTAQRKKPPHKKATQLPTSHKKTSRSGLAEENYNGRNLDKRKQQATVKPNNAEKIAKVPSPTAAERSTAKDFSVDKRTTSNRTGSPRNIEIQHKQPIPAAQPDTARASLAATRKTVTAKNLHPISDHRTGMKPNRVSKNQPGRRRPPAGKLFTRARIRHHNNNTLKPAHSEDLVQQSTKSVKRKLGPTLQTPHFQVTASPRSIESRRETNKFQGLQTKPSTSRRLHITTIVSPLPAVANQTASAKGTLTMNPHAAVVAKAQRYRPRKVFNHMKTTGTSEVGMSKEDRRPNCRRREYQQKHRYHHHHRRRYHKTRLRARPLQDKKHRLSSSLSGESQLPHGGKEGHDKHKMRSLAKVIEDSNEKTQ